MTTPTDTTAGPLSEVELAVGGMTCASCSARIEKKLNRLDGVTASVNLATEKAKVAYAPGVEVADLVATVQKLGYTAEPVAREEPAEPAADGPDGARDEPPHEIRTEAGSGSGTESDPTAPERRRLVVCALLSLPVVLLAMVPALQFDNWQWLSLTLAAPVAVWGGLPFHRAAWTNARHGAATMDTLVSVGTLAAFGWSLWALFLGDAGTSGMRHGFTFAVDRTDASSTIYLEVARASSP